MNILQSIRVCLACSVLVASTSLSAETGIRGSDIDTCNNYISTAAPLAVGINVGGATPALCAQGGAVLQAFVITEGCVTAFQQNRLTLRKNDDNPGQLNQAICSALNSCGLLGAAQGAGVCEWFPSP